MKQLPILPQSYQRHWEEVHFVTFIKYYYTESCVWSIKTNISMWFHCATKKKIIFKDIIKEISRWFLLAWNKIKVKGSLLINIIYLFSVYQEQNMLSTFTYEKIESILLYWWLNNLAFSCSTLMQSDKTFCLIYIGLITPTL